jgi:methyl-accepting chemotaxis protein
MRKRSFSMLDWFIKDAPIRTKLSSLTLAVVAFSALGLAGAVVAALGLAPAAVSIGLAALGVGGAFVCMSVATPLIANPYVDIVERIEAMAAGDYASPIPHEENNDCVGRLARACSAVRVMGNTLESRPRPRTRWPNAAQPSQAPRRQPARLPDRPALRPV